MTRTQSAITTMCGLRVPHLGACGENNQAAELGNCGSGTFPDNYEQLLRGAHGIIIENDVTDKESFNNAEKWVGEINKDAADGVNKLLVGNKCDLASEKGRIDR